MKICVLGHTLNDKTGSGEFISGVIKSIKISLPEADFEVLTSEDFLKPNWFLFAKNFSAIRKKIKEADIIHAMDAYPYGVIALLTNMFINKPLIVTSIGTGSLRLFESQGLKAWLFRMAYLKAQKVVAISQYVSREIKKNMQGIDPQVITPGIDYGYWSFKPTIQSEVAKNIKEPYLLSVGELKSRKGYEMMISVVGEVMKSVEKVNYVIVANTERNLKYKEKILNQIKELGIEDRVFFLSDLSREELREVYQRALVYLAMPQNSHGDIEGFGMSILQAASSGTPAVVLRGSGADDALVSGQSGFLVSSKEEAEEKIKELVLNGDLLASLSQGASLFSQSMIWDRKGEAYVKIYQELQHEKS